MAEVDGVLAGTVQLHKAWPPNQPHRGEVAKLLVHRDYRRMKLGSRLMRAVIPGYAYSVDNQLVDTAIFYKQLA